MPARKRWLGFTARPRGTIHIDAGARRAVVELGKSLLLVGVSTVEGEFGKGDVVRICDSAGTEIGRGLSNYSAEDARRLRGLQTEQIVSLVGSVAYPEFVHRDNLVLVG